MTPKYHIQVENSAPSQLRPAQSVKWASQRLKIEGAKSIVDLGCGRLRNLKILRKNFSNITLVDTKLQCERIVHKVPRSSTVRLMSIDEFIAEERMYDAIFMISVLHTIDRLAIRKGLLALARERLRDLGFLVVDVPTGENYYRVHCTAENKYLDGWVMGTGPIKTFYTTYHAKELDSLVKSCTSFDLYMKLSLDKHIVRIWQKLKEPRLPK